MADPSKPYATKYPGVRRRPGKREVFDAYYRDGAGRQIWKRGFTSATAANSWRQENLRRVRQTGWERPERQTVEAFLAEYITGQGLRGKQRESSQERYRILLRRQIAPEIGSVLVHELTPARLQAFLDGLLEDLAPATVHKAYGLLRAAYRQARKRRQLFVIPTDSVDLPTLEEPECYLPSDAELERILSELDAPWRAIAELATHTALRRGELCGLRWSAVRFQDGFLDVREQIQGRGDSLAFVKPKSRTSVRPVVLVPEAVELLRSVRAEQLERRDLLGDGWQDYGTVFDSGLGAPIIPGSLTQAYGRAAERAGVPATRLHDLRHLAITRWVERGVNVGTVSAMAGHSSVAFTLRRYFTAREEAQLDARDRMAGASRSASREPIPSTVAQIGES